MVVYGYGHDSCPSMALSSCLSGVWSAFGWDICTALLGFALAFLDYRSWDKQFLLTVVISGKAFGGSGK